MSGLHRYATELYIRTSQQANVKRYHYGGFNLNSFINYKPGDITHITTQSFAFLKVLKNVKNCVITINDLIPEVEFNRVQKIREKWILSEFVLDKADHYIAISDYTKMQLMCHYPKIDVNDITVVYDGVDHNVFKPQDRQAAKQKFKFNDSKPYLLVVSSDKPWKHNNVVRNLPYNIIYTGYGNGQYGFISDGDMVDLYNACDILLIPSTHEGFCLPAVEAMACGTPVIYANETALPEVIGYGGYSIDNIFDQQSWIDAVDCIMSSWNSWSSRAILCAQQYSWDKCAIETLAVYDLLER